LKLKVPAIICSVLALTVQAGCTRGARPPEVKPVYVIQSTPPNMLTQLRAREIDGFIAWEPYGSMAVLEGSARYLARSAELWKGHPCCVLVTAGSLADPGLIRALVWAHVKAARFLNDPVNQEKVIQYAMEFTGATREVAVAAIRNTAFVEYPHEEGIRDYYRGLQEGRLLKRTHADLGYPSEEDFLSSFLVRTFYAEIGDRLKEDPAWVPEPLPVGTRLRLGYIGPSLQHLPLYVAQREGFFARVGLVPGSNLELKNYTNGVMVMEAFRARELDAAYVGSAPAVLKRVNDGIDVQVVGGVAAEGSAIVVRADSGIRNLHDLAGKTIAVPGIGTVQYYLLEKAVSSKNLKLVLK